MSEEMSPKLASDISASHYRRYTGNMDKVDLTQRLQGDVLKVAMEHADEVERARSFIDKETRDVTRSDEIDARTAVARQHMDVHRRKKDEAVHAISRLASIGADARIAARQDAQGPARDFYLEYGGPLHDAAVADAQQEGVTINVEQPGEASQQVHVDTHGPGH